MAHAQLSSPQPVVPLASILCTEELQRRPSRLPNSGAVTDALLKLARTMADSPESIMQQLVDSAMNLCQAHSAGISLLEEENGRKIFRWHGVAGQYAPHLGGTTPRDFSPCGTVLDTDAVQLMSQLDRHFVYFADVEPRIAEALLIPLRVAGTAVGTLWVIAHDLTRKFDAEDARVLATLGEFAAAAYQALAKAVDLNGIVATIREPLLLLDADLRVKIANRSFYQTFQVTPEETAGRLFFEIGNGQWDIPALRASLEELLPKESMIENFEVTQDFPALGQRVMVLNARLLRNENRPSSLILLAIDDITTRRRKEDELRRSQEDSQRFASVAAHDLRAPLNSSMTLLELLDRRIGKTLGGSDRHLLSLARNNLKRLQELMGGILAYTRVGGAQHRTLIDLHGPLQAALDGFQSEIESGEMCVENSLMPSLKADGILMTQVFQNLISNAFKFRAARPLAVKIRAVRELGKWVMSIADNGEGFDPRYAEQIFQPFARLHGSEVDGSGIGLATCKRIIQRLGGCIWAESVPGQGATFFFTLPDE